MCHYVANLKNTQPSHCRLTQWPSLHIHVIMQDMDVFAWNVFLCPSAHSQRLVSVQSMLRQTGRYRTLERDLMELQERKLFEYFIVVALHKTKAGVPYLPEVTQQFPLKVNISTNVTEACYSKIRNWRSTWKYCSIENIFFSYFLSKQSFFFFNLTTGISSYIVYGSVWAPGRSFLGEKCRKLHILHLWAKQQQVSCDKKGIVWLFAWVVIPLI